MVCSFESGRMAVMARLLEAQSWSKNIAEEVGCRKLAAQYIYRELCQADEANLLDEEDMHVFGLKPMADSLMLVCCNACKKPVKASQYVVHAELCRSLSTEEEAIVDNDGSTGNRKPPRKERKRLLSSYNNQVALVGGQERSRSIIADDTAVSESQVAGNVGIGSFSINGKRVSPEDTDHSTCVMPPQAKRSKLEAGERLPLSDEMETASGVTKTRSSQDAYISRRDLSRQTIPSVVMPKDCVVCINSRQVHKCCLPTKGVPAPLATKVYYSQRNNHLSSALSLLFQEVATKEFDMVSQQSSQKDTMQLHSSSQRGCSFDRTADLLPQKEDPSTWNDDQVLSQNTEACSAASGIHLQDFSNQSSVDNVPRPPVGSIGLMRSKYLSDPYSFSGNSGKLLGTMQQQNGRVHVV